MIEGVVSKQSNKTAQIVGAAARISWETPGAYFSKFFMKRAAKCFTEFGIWGEDGVGKGWAGVLRFF
ncbi:MAG: hypothetical protein HC867_00535 [Bacteroidia bacterium]|nr:hypothetical protein [Bacteroidia bacterium]